MLLETVALVPHDDQSFAGTGGKFAYRDHCGCQQQKLLVLVAVKGNASRDVERMVEGTGSGEYPCVVDEGAGIRMRNSCAPC